MITSPNMGLRIPQIGFDNDPAWETQFIYSFNKIDTHTHDGAGAGVKIPFNNLNFATTPAMANNPLTAVSYLSLQQQASLQSPAAGVGVLEVRNTNNGELFFINGTSQIPIVTNGAVQSTKGFLGDYATLGAGGAYYNASAVTGGAVANTFYFYQSNTPTLDSSTHANIAAANAYLRLGTGAPAWSSSLTGPFIGFSNTSQNDTWYFGMLGTSLGESLFGLQVNGGAGTYPGASYPVSMYETTISQTMTAAPTGPSSKTWAVRINDISQLTGGTPEAFGVRSTTTSVTTGGSLVYQLAQSVATNGTIQQPQNRFGSQYKFKAQSTTANGTADGATGAWDQAILDAYWYGTGGGTTGSIGGYGGFRIYCPIGGSGGTTGLDMAQIGGGGFVVGLNKDTNGLTTPAGQSTTHIGGASTIFYNGPYPVTTATYDLGTTALRWANLWLSGNITATGAGAFGGAVSGTTGTFSSTAQATTMTVTSTGSFVTNQATSFKNTSILAWGVVNNSGTLLFGFNAATSRSAAGLYTMTFITNPTASTNCAVLVTPQSSGSICANVTGQTANGFTLNTTLSSSTANTDSAWYFMIVGTP